MTIVNYSEINFNYFIMIKLLFRQTFQQYLSEFGNVGNQETTNTVLHFLKRFKLNFKYLIKHLFH